MASMLQSSFEASGPQSHHGIHSSPIASPQIHRPASQASFHVAPVTGHYSPPFTGEASPQLFSAYSGPHPQPFKPYQPGSLSLPLPHSTLNGDYPSTAPLLPYYPSQTPLYDARTSQPMIRTISHAHPMHSATEQTTSSRYSSSPHSANPEAPPTAGGGFPSFHLSNVDNKHVNPAIFSSYPMSRSTSGASDGAPDFNGRLLTPHYDYRTSDGQLTTNEADLRKVSDSLGRMPTNRYYTIPPQVEFSNLHHGGFSPHPQPNMEFYMNNNATRGWGNEFAMSAERGGKHEMDVQIDTEYERQRAQQINNNKKLLEGFGLGIATPYMRSRNISSGTPERSRKASTPVKKRLTSDGPVRASPRIASLHRNVSYADLDGGPVNEGSEEGDEYNAENDQDDEEEFRPTKRTKGLGKSMGRKTSYIVQRSARRPDLSLYGLLEVYKEIPHLFPLFYYTLNNDLTINSDSIPLIGSIPSTVTPLEKAESLKNFFHRGRRVLAQLDAFTVRCDRKYEGPEERWPELDYHTRIAIRDVRRKIVERCENYKYTRRDLLDKCLGKNKWQPIDQDLIEWRSGMAQNDPAGDLSNVTLTLPTPPPSMLTQQDRSYPVRQIRSFPSRARLNSGVPQSARIASVTMAEPGQYPPATAPMMGYGYPSRGAPSPMYGENNTPMSLHLPGQHGQNTQTSSLPMFHNAPQMPNSASVTPATFSWTQNPHGIKRSRSEEEEEKAEELNFNTGERDAPTLWQE